eukprot:SAG22_NODE_3328_length_1776_cov_1.011330_2_plen_119_part_00
MCVRPLVQLKAALEECEADSKTMQAEAAKTLEACEAARRAVADANAELKDQLDRAEARQDTSSAAAARQREELEAKQAEVGRLEKEMRERVGGRTANKPANLPLPRSLARHAHRSVFV